MADYKLLAILATGKPGVPNASNFGLITKLKVGNVTLEGDTVDGVDLATLKSDYDTHDGGTAKAQHSAIGDHTHVSAGAEGGTVDHGALTGRGDDDHTLYTKADGSRPFTGVVAGVTPTSGTHLVTKSYADGLRAGIDMKEAVRAATTAALPACTYANGTLGVGATLTADADGAIPAQDGVSMALNDRILVKNQATAAHNGIYKVTALGDVSNPWVFTRTTDADEADDVDAGMMVFVDEGTSYADQRWVCISDVETVGTDAQTFTKHGPGTMSHDELNDVSINDHHTRDHDLDGSEHGTCTKAELSGKLTDDTLLGQLDVDDTPVNGVTTAPVSSNWAYDHINTGDQHPEYQKESEKDAASGYMGLDAGSHGNSSPKHHDTTHENGGDDEMSLAGLDGEPATLTTHKAVVAANAVLGHVIVEDASKIDVDGSGKLTLGTHASTHQDSGSDEVGSATPAADTIVKSDADGKIGSGWIDDADIDHGGIGGLGDDDHSQYHNDSRAETWHDADDHDAERAADVTISGDKHFNGEVTADVVIADGDHRGLQHAKTAGLGGVTAGNAVKFDGTGKIVIRAGADDGCIGIACTTAAADAAAYFAFEGIHAVTWVAGKEPTANGQNVFLCNTAGNYHKWTTDVPEDGKGYTGIADGTGASAKVMIIPGQRFAYE